MKKFLVVLLSLGLVMTFSMPAFAVSADFSGQYYVRQNYYSNPSLLDQDKGAGRDSWADTDQRLRLFTRLKVVEGVTLTSRVDILETIWGRDQSLFPTSSLPAAPTAKQTKDYNSANASFEQLYLTFATGIGQFEVGYRQGTPFAWGTFFLNAPADHPSIVWRNTFGDLTVQADVAKTQKGDMSSAVGSGSLVSPNLAASDVDKDYYDLSVKYQGKGLEAGLLTTYFRYADQRVAQALTATTSTTATGALTTAMVLDPYFKAKLGPVDLEGEAYYMGGKVAYDEPRGANSDQSIKAKGIYLGGKFKMGPAWAGGSFIYTSGNDPSAKAGSGQDITGGKLGTFGYANGDIASGIWSNYLPNILYGYTSDTIHLYTPLKGNSTNLTQVYDNLWLYNISGGMAVGKKLSFDGKLSFAKLDKVDPAVSNDDKLGTELDLRGTYKIYDCLSYNIGAAYLWTGDYYKGTKTEAVANTYFLTQWLDLRF